MGFTRRGKKSGMAIARKFDASKKQRPTVVGARRKNQTAIQPNNLLSVAAAQHLGEGLNLLLPTALLTRLFEITLRTSAFDDVLAIELLLHATQRTVDGLILANLDFDGHLNRRGRTNG